MSTVRLIAYSDYLCPWCYNASVRLHRLVDGDPGVEVEWRSYLLRPSAGRGRDLEKFRAYTASWMRPASEPDSGEFTPWASEEGPPSHSIPAHLAAKAAALLGEDAFRRYHDRLLRAYFTENRDISSDTVLRELWTESGLPGADFERREDPQIVQRVLAEHDEAIACGATGVPSVRLADHDAVITGAMPFETYERWVARVRERTDG